MNTTATDPRIHNVHVSCHLGMHDWVRVRDDENLAHYACRHCDHMKAVNRPWWDFASEAGTGFH